jgi:hypothetical protein
MAIAGGLLTKTRVVKIKIETEKGTKVDADTAVYFENPVLVETTEFTERNGSGLYRGYMVKGVTGVRTGKFTGSCEIKGSGAGGAETGVAILLQACGLKKTLEVYQVHSDPDDDVTISVDMWESGRKKSLAGAAGVFTLRGEPGGRVMMDVDLDGLWQDVADDALPTWSPSASAPFMNKGGAFTLASNAIKIATWTLSSGGVVVPRRDIAAAQGILCFMISDQIPMFGCDPEADLVANYDYHGIFTDGTEAAVSLQVNNGTDKCTIAIPKFQTREKNEGDRDGILIHELNGQCNHSSGNDALSLTFASVA